MFQGQLHPKKQRKIATLEQWVEVTIEEGQTVTRLYPSNEGVIRRGQKMLPLPELVYQRLNFRTGCRRNMRGRRATRRHESWAG